jgi:flavin reductase (DIM6/NTAB) family NADH-FMN oxidoreductase RutF
VNGGYLMGRQVGAREAWRASVASVALVTTCGNGRTNVMAAEWSLRVSLDPVLFAVFVGKERGTYFLLDSSGEFGLNYCSDEQAHLAWVAGHYSIREGVDKWSLAPFSTFPARRISPPLIEGCVSNLECRVVSRFETGDHAAFVGEVLESYYDPNKSPLVYRGGRYHRLGPRIIVPTERG